MRHKPASPTCPKCGVNLPWRSISENGGAWDYRCPGCRALLEAPLQQLLFYAVPFGGAGLIAIAALYLDADSFNVACGILGVVAVVVAVVAWKLTRFTVKIR
jgi:hypothetical protein